MEKLIFDSGIKEYELGAGILRFNPSDPNVYARFMDAIEEVKTIEQDMVEQGKALKETDPALNLLRDADTKVKAQLDAVFPGNCFDDLLEGVNLMATAGNGERVVTNLLDALTPIIEEGVERFTNSAVNEAKANREQRRAAQKGQV